MLKTSVSEENLQKIIGFDSSLTLEKWMMKMKKNLPIYLFLALILQSISANAAICEKEFMGFVGASGEKLKSENPTKFYDAFIYQKAMFALIIDGEFEDQVKPSDPMFETPLFKCVKNAISSGDLTVTDSEKSIVRKSYLSYQKKVRFVEVISSVGSNKVAVEKCYLNTRSFHGCNAGSHGIQKNIGKITGGETVNGTNLYPAKGSKFVAGIKVEDGVITGEAINGKGFNGETYVLTPTITMSGEVNWIVSGTCESAGFCK